MTGSVTEAAKRLGVTQPAVSRLLSDFEGQVGFQLFRRVGRSLVPTDLAQDLAAEVERSRTGLEHVKRVANEIQVYGLSRLSIVTTASLAMTVVPKLVRTFADQYPQTAVAVDIRTNEVIRRWVEAHNHDFGVMYDLGVQSMNTQLLQEGSGFCVMPRGHPLTDLDVVRPEDLEGKPFVSYLSGTQPRHIVDEAFRHSRAPRLLKFEAPNTSAICRLVAEGAGLGLILGVRPDDNMVLGCEVRPFEPRLAYSAVLAWLPRSNMTPVAKAFRTVARDFARCN